MARNSLRNVAKLIDTVKKDLPPEQSFITELKRSMEMDSVKNPHKPSTLYKPSGMNCIRSMYYTRMGKPLDNTDTSYINIGICNTGSDIHERVQTAVSLMKENNIDCEYVDVAEFVKLRNIPNLTVTGQRGMETHLIHNTLSLSFLCDGIIRYKGHYYILELKTESATKWYNRDGVDPKHYNQAIAYSIALDLPEVIFVYINRDIFDFKSYLFTPTDEMKQNFIGLIEECNSYVKRMIAPPKPDNIEKRICEYCGYKSLCRKEL